MTKPQTRSLSQHPFFLLLLFFTTLLITTGIISTTIPNPNNLHKDLILIPDLLPPSLHFNTLNPSQSESTPLRIPNKYVVQSPAPLVITGDILPFPSGSNQFIVNGTISINPELDLDLANLLTSLDEISITTSNPPVTSAKPTNDNDCDPNNNNNNRAVNSSIDTCSPLEKIQELTALLYTPRTSSLHSYVKFTSLDQTAWSFEPAVMDWDEQAPIQEAQSEVGFFIIFQFPSTTSIISLQDLISTRVEINYITKNPEYLDHISTLYIEFGIDEGHDSRDAEVLMTEKRPRDLIMETFPFVTPTHSISINYQYKTAGQGRYIEYTTININIPPLSQSVKGISISLFGLGHFLIPKNKNNIIPISINAEPTFGIFTPDETNPQWAWIIIDEVVLEKNLYYDVNFDIVVNFPMATNQILYTLDHHLDNSNNKASNDRTIPLPSNLDYIWAQVFSKRLVNEFSEFKQIPAIIIDRLPLSNQEPSTIQSFIKPSFLTVENLPSISVIKFPFTSPVQAVVVQYQLKYDRLDTGNIIQLVDGAGHDNNQISLPSMSLNDIHHHDKALSFVDSIHFTFINSNVILPLSPSRVDVNITSTSGAVLATISLKPITNDHTTPSDQDQSMKIVSFPKYDLALPTFFAQTTTFNITCFFHFDTYVEGLYSNNNTNNNSNNSIRLEADDPTDLLPTIQVQLGLTRSTENVISANSSSAITSSLLSTKTQPSTTSTITIPATATIVANTPLATKVKINTFSSLNEYRSHKFRFSVLLYGTSQSAHDLTMTLATPNFQFIGDTRTCYLSSGQSIPDMNPELINPKHIRMITDTYGRGTGVVMEPHDMVFTIGMAYNLTCASLYITTYPIGVLDISYLSAPLTMAIESTYGTATTIGDVDMNIHPLLTGSLTASALINFSITKPNPDPPPPTPPQPSMWLKILLWSCLAFIIVAIIVLIIKLIQRHKEYTIYLERQKEKLKQRYKQNSDKKQAYDVESVLPSPHKPPSSTFTFQQQRQGQQITEQAKLLHPSRPPSSSSSQRIFSSSNFSTWSDNIPNDNVVGADSNNSSLSYRANGSTELGDNDYDGASYAYYDDAFSQVSGSNPYQQPARAISPRGSYYGDDADNLTFVEWLFSSKTSFWNGKTQQQQPPSSQNKLSKTPKKNSVNQQNSMGLPGLSPQYRGPNNNHTPKNDPRTNYYDDFDKNSNNDDSNHPYSRNNYYEATMSIASTEYLQSTKGNGDGRETGKPMGEGSDHGIDIVDYDQTFVGLTAQLDNNDDRDDDEGGDGTNHSCDDQHPAHPRRVTLAHDSTRFYTTPNITTSLHDDQPKITISRIKKTPNHQNTFHTGSLRTQTNGNHHVDNNNNNNNSIQGTQQLSQPNIFPLSSHKPQQPTPSLPEIASGNRSKSHKPQQHFHTLQPNQGKRGNDNQNGFYSTHDDDLRSLDIETPSSNSKASKNNKGVK